MPQFRHLFAVLSLIGLSSLSACDKSKQDERRGLPPPETSAATPGGCSQGGGTLTDPSTATQFPRSFSDYCIDPHGETRTYGASASKDIDAICTEAFNGDCEMYKSFGLERVILFRYIDGGGSPGAVDVVVSKYASSEGAFGMFTKRVISDGDPARQDAPKEMLVEGMGALGAGTAYLWKAQIVVEMTYTNDRQTPQQVQETASRLLSALSKVVAAKLPAPATLPTAATRLPAENRIALGIRFEPKDVFGVQGGGAGAFGYYQHEGKRYRVVSIIRDDADQAKDLLTALSKREGVTKLKDLGEGGVRMMEGEPGDVRIEWVMARSGPQVFGIGDESSSLRAEMSATDHDAVCLTKEQKVERLKALLSVK